MKRITTTLVVFETTESAINHINNNYSIEAFNPQKLIENINKSGVTRVNDGTIVIVDEFGLLN